MTVLITSLFELSIFALGFLGTDLAQLIDAQTHQEHEIYDDWFEIFKNFSFSCKNDKDGISRTFSKWYVDYTNYSMTLFKLHFIVIFMYTIIFTIVLWEIPFRYDRLKKTSSEKKKEKARLAKRKNKKSTKPQPSPTTADFFDTFKETYSQDTNRQGRFTTAINSEMLGTLSRELDEEKPNLENERRLSVDASRGVEANSALFSFDPSRDSQWQSLMNLGNNLDVEKTESSRLSKMPSIQEEHPDEESDMSPLP